jgi:hypothetical protein
VPRQQTEEGVTSAERFDGEGWCTRKSGGGGWCKRLVVKAGAPARLVVGSGLVGSGLVRSGLVRSGLVGGRRADGGVGVRGARLHVEDEGDVATDGERTLLLLPQLKRTLGLRRADRQTHWQVRRDEPRVRQGYAESEVGVRVATWPQLENKSTPWLG